MTDKLVNNVRGVRSSEDLQQMQTDLMNLQKLIAVSFQAMKSTINKPTQQQQPQFNLPL
jgi:hypothetical protein